MGTLFQIIMSIVVLILFALFSWNMKPQFEQITDNFNQKITIIAE